MAGSQHAGAGDVAHARELPAEVFHQHFLLAQDFVHPERDARESQPEHDRWHAVRGLARRGIPRHLQHITEPDQRNRLPAERDRLPVLYCLDILIGYSRYPLHAERGNDEALLAGANQDATEGGERQWQHHPESRSGVKASLDCDDAAQPLDFFPHDGQP